MYKYPVNTPIYDCCVYPCFMFFDPLIYIGIITQQFAKSSYWKQPPKYNQEVKPQRLVTACKKKIGRKNTHTRQNLVLNSPAHLNDTQHTHTHKTEANFAMNVRSHALSRLFHAANEQLRSPARLNMTFLGLDTHACAWTLVRRVVFLLVRSVCNIRGMQALPWLLPKATGTL